MSSTIMQLNPPLPVKTPKGDGLAHLVIDYGPEHNLMWTVFLDENGECWTFENPQVRAQKNVTVGRNTVPELPAGDSPSRANGNGKAFTAPASGPATGPA